MRIVIGCVVTLVIGIFLFLGAAYISVEHGTRYAHGFSESKFAQVKYSMPQEDVKRLLGEPLRAERHASRLYRVKLRTGEKVPVKVTYDEDGYVLSADGEVARKRGVTSGMYRKDAESALHTTSSTHGGFRIYWSYALPRLIASEYQVRDIEFDESGRVSHIDHSYFEW